MTFLLDTNVVSETRKRRPGANVVRWLEKAEPETLFLSVLTVGELAKGIAKVRRTQPETAADLTHWLRGLERIYADRLIPIDTEIAERWGELSAGRTLPVMDTLLAATAIVRDLTFVTRNVSDVASTGPQVLNPWEPV